MNAIHLLPLGDAERALSGSLQHGLEEVFHMPVRMLSSAIDIEPFFDEERAQYNSTEILLHLKRNAPALLRGELDGSGYKLLALTSADLFIPILTYVFGEAEVGGAVAVVSYNRLQTERYGLPPDPALLLERTLKEAVHELGHLFALLHCPDPACVMYSSSYVEDIDPKGSVFCAECWRRVIGG